MPDWFLLFIKAEPKAINGHLNKKANRYLKWGMIEAAKRAKTINPLLRRKVETIERKKGAGVATVAMTHHLLIIVYHILKEQRGYLSWQV
jgi:transposase